MRRLAIFCPLDHGGIADYIHFQANALSDVGVKVELITTNKFQKLDYSYEIKPILPSESKVNNSLVRKFLYFVKIVRDVRIFCDYVKAQGIKYILIGGFAEYGSPFWVHLFKDLKNRGCIIGCIIHDPVRDFQLGPKFWHKLSIKLAYDAIHVAYVHHHIDLNKYGASESIHSVTIPFPSFPFDQDPVFSSEIRKSFGIADNDIVMLSFGHIRDGKNIGLILKAMVDHPTVHLIVAGKEQSSGAKQASYYLELADELSVVNRFHLINRFIEEAELADLFAAADFAVLTYSSDFHSGSGALGACVHFRKRMLVSAAEGPLIKSVEKYELGVAVSPDCAKSISGGISKMIEASSTPRWDAFDRENSWEANARLVWDSLCLFDKTGES